MLGFIAVLTVSVLAVLLVQALDIECANPVNRSPRARLRRAVSADAAYADCAAVGGLR
jgi:hypothetical protein